MGHRRAAADGVVPPPKGPSLISPIKPALIAALTLTWGHALATTAILILAGAALDRLLAGEALGTPLTVGLVGAAIARGAVAAAVPLITVHAAGRLESWGRRTVYAHLVALGAPLRSSRRTGQLVSTATEAVELMSVYYATFLGPILASMSVPVFVIGAIAVFIDGWAALWLVIVMPIIPLMVGGFQQRFQAVSDGYRETANSLSARFLDALQGLPTLKLFNRGQDHGEDLARSTEHLRVAIMRLLAGNQIVLLVVDAGFSLGMVTLSSALAMVRFRAGAITAGQAIALVLLGLLLIEPLDKVGQFFYVGMGGMAAAKEVKAVLAEVPQVSTPAVDTPAPVEAPATITFEDVRFRYSEDTPEVLRGISFEVAAGETVALVGASGAGKSTIATLLQRQVAHGSGTIRVGGVDVQDVPGEWVRDRITVVAQRTYLFTGTLRSNLLMARPSATDEQLWDALATANLDAFVKRLPEGLDTIVGERGLSLSGGEAQRVAIARAALKDAPIVVLDEPTSNIDVESEAAILAALDRLTVDRTVVVIAHRLSTVADADRIIVLADGVVLEQGTPAELAASGGAFAAALQRNAEVRA